MAFLALFSNSTEYSVSRQHLSSLNLIVMSEFKVSSPMESLNSVFIFLTTENALSELALLCGIMRSALASLDNRGNLWSPPFFLHNPFWPKIHLYLSPGQGFPGHQPVGNHQILPPVHPSLHLISDGGSSGQVLSLKQRFLLSVKRSLF